MRSKTRDVNILVLNCGSSSLKYKIIRMPQETTVVQGETEKVGIKTEGGSVITHESLGKKRVIQFRILSHAAALEKILELIAEDARRNKGISFDIFAHRYVHPGNFFTGTAGITRQALAKLKETLPLAAIHNRISYGLIEFCRKKYPQTGQFAVFDTTFHRSIPPRFHTYAIPRGIARKYGLRRMGFHGISHRYIMEEACRFLGRSRDSQRIISCHLGTGGSSVCAIENGKSVNNSMGFTPLEGLIMNTRSGSVDPGAVFYTMFRENFSYADAEEVLNRKSGILSLFKRSSDLREAMGSMRQDKGAAIAFEMYVRRVRAYIGFYSLILRKADILAFTDSLGTGEPFLREKICADLDFLGINLDAGSNAGYRQGIKDISSAGAGARILVIPANEELMIARETYKEFVQDDPRS